MAKTTSKTTTTETALRSLQAAKDAARTLTETEDALRTRHAELTRERKKVAHAAPALPELLANVDALVDRARAKWREEMSSYAVRAIGGHTTFRGTGDTAEVRHAPELPSLGADGRLTLRDLAGLMPEMLKQSLSETLHARPPESFGLAAEERAVRLQELDVELADVERQHVELVDGAAGCGITLPLLPHVAERREREASAEQQRADTERQRIDAQRKGLPAPTPEYVVTY